MKTLVIGCGTLERRDDAAGLHVARRLRELGFDAREHSGDGLDLMELWSANDDVILIDAVHGGGAPGSLHCWAAADAPLNQEFYACSTHHLGVNDAIRLGARLGRLPNRFRVYGITAADVGRGEGLSPEVAVAIDDLAKEIAIELGDRVRAAGMH